MVFSDLFFIFAFLPSFALCYLLAGWMDKQFFSTPLEQKNHIKNSVLIAFSLIFYAWGEPIYVFLMLGSVAINYIAGRIIDKQEKHRKKALIGGLICNLLILGTFKYAGFFAQSLTSIGISVADPKIALPIGISFYTFQAISYLIDVYRRESPAQRNFFGLLMYISMFPQLIAGPIVRYNTVAQEISKRRVTAADFADGSYRFLIGLGKKVFLANQFSTIADQFLANGLNDLSTSGAWVGILAFSLQIFFDFSGYSDMAIGLGRCLGFHFNENFNHPYCCNSITDFWRRWHMSIGSFFRDYVYIPMGGNRHHQALNIMVVWFLTGMWHGASWNFIIWGVYFGLIVMVEKYTILRWKEHIPAVFLHLYSLILVVIGWGIFYFEDFGKMQIFFSSFFGNTTKYFDLLSQTAFTDNFWLWVIALIFCLPVYNAVNKLHQRIFANHEKCGVIVATTTRIIISALLLISCVALLVGATNNAFIYTRF
jgi:alginate O-acetyltransferase complex protein AlgI